MKTKKRLLSVILVVLFVLTMIATLAACGEEEEMVEYTVTLKSGFDSETMTAKVNEGDDSETMTAKVNEGDVYILPESPFVRDGYTFTYWTEEGQSYRKPAGTQIPVYKNTVFVANWEDDSIPTPPAEYTVTLTDGYASGSVTVSVPEGSEYTLPAGNTFTRPGYTFAGWKAWNIIYNAGDTMTVNGNVTLSALWDAIQSYKVTVNPGNGEVADTTFVAEGGSFTLPDPKDYSGYTFLGYREEGASDELLEAGTEITNITSDRTFVAVWEAITYYTVTLKASEDEGETQISVYEEILPGSEFTLPSCGFKKTGFDFRAWKSGETEYAPNETITVNENVVIYALWDKQEVVATEYSVSYYADGHAPRFDTQLYSEGDTCTVKDNPFKLDQGLRFLYWTVRGDESSAEYKPGDEYTIGTSDVVFEAVLDEIVYYTVTLSDGMGDKKSSRVEAGSEYVLPSEDIFDGKGQIFVNWVVDGAKKAPGEKITINGDTTVTAEWRQQKSYIVTYSAGYEGGSTFVVTVSEFEAPNYTLAAAPERDGYDFYRWSKDDTLYEAGSVYPVTENATFTALWKKITVTFKITFVNHDATVDGYPYTQPNGGYTPVPSLSGIEGYTFLGWAIEGSTDIVIAPGKETYQATSDVTFVAVWEQNKYTVSFLDLNGALLEAPQTVLWGEHPTVPEVETEIIKDLQTVSSFNGWRSSVDSGLYSSDNIPAATADVTYQAEYTDSTRYYPIVLGDTDYITYLTKEDEEIIGTPQVAFGNAFSFKIQAKNIAVNIDEVEVYGNGKYLSSNNGVYEMDFDLFAESEAFEIEVRGYTVTRYTVLADADTNITEYQFLVNDEEYAAGELLDYGDTLTVKVKAGEYHAEGVRPILEINGEKIISGISEADADGYYSYAYTINGNVRVALSAGEEKVIPITYVDIADTEYNVNWTYSMGPIGNLAVAPMGSDYKNPYLFDNVYYRTGFADTEDGLYRICAWVSEKEDRLMEGDNFTADKLALELATTGKQYPKAGGDNIYYIAYVHDQSLPTRSIYVAVPDDAAIPGDGNTENKFIWRRYQGIGEDGAAVWSDWNTTLGSLTSTLYHPGGWSLKPISAPINSIVQVAFYSETLKSCGENDGDINMYAFKGSGVVTPKLTSVEYGGETMDLYVYDLKIHNYNIGYYLQPETVGYVQMHGNIIKKSPTVWYLGEDDSSSGNVISKTEFVYWIKPDVKIYFKLGFFTSTFPDFQKKYLNDNGDGTFSLKEEVINTSGLFNIAEGDYEEGNIQFYAKKGNNVRYDVYISFIPTGDVSVTINTIGVGFDEEPDSLPPESTFRIYFHDSEYYDWYKGKGDNAEKLNTSSQASFVVGDFITIKPKDGVNGFTFSDVNDIDLVIWYSGSYRYRLVNLVNEGYAEVESYSEDEIVFKIIKIDGIDEYQFSLKNQAPVKVGLVGILQGAAELIHESNKCASSVAENEITVNAPLYSELDGSATITVTVKEGQVPVLWVDYLDHRGLFAVEGVESNANTYTFSLTGVTSTTYWYLETKTRTYPVTFIINGEELILEIPHGTLISDIEELPTFYVGDLGLGEGMAYYNILGWMNADDTEVTMIFGDAVLTAELEYVNSVSVVFESSAGDVSGYENLASALEALDEGAKGDLYVLYIEGESQLLDSGATYTVPAGVSLHLPYAEDCYGRAHGDTTASTYYTKEAGYAALEIAEGTTLEIDGKISVGGIVGYPGTGPSGPYQGMTSGAHAILTLNGNLIVKGGGVLDVNGYIIGKGTVTLESGAISYLPFVVKDYLGGSNTTSVFFDGYAPFNIYEMPNIQTNYIIKYGATEYAYAMLYASESFQEAFVEVIGDNGIIRLSENNNGVESRVEKLVEKVENLRYSSQTAATEPEYEFRTTLNIYGGGRDGVMTLTLGSFFSVDTAEKFLAIPYTYKEINLLSGNYKLYNMYKIMPGASLNVMGDATLELVSEFNQSLGRTTTAAIAVYDLSDTDVSYIQDVEKDVTSIADHLKCPVEPNGDGVKAGRLSISGKLIVYGKIAGMVTAGAEGAKLQINCSDTNLSIATEEVYHLSTTSLVTTYHFNDFAKITNKDGVGKVAPGVVYTSTTSENGQIIWK